MQCFFLYLPNYNMPKLIFCFEKKIINLKGKERQIFSICWVTSQHPVTTGALEEGLGALGQDWASSGRSAIQAGAPICSTGGGDSYLASSSVPLRSA